MQQSIVIKVQSWASGRGGSSSPTFVSMRRNENAVRVELSASARGGARSAHRARFGTNPSLDSGDTVSRVRRHQRHCCSSRVSSKCKVRLRDAAGTLLRLSCPCGAMKTPSASSFPHRHEEAPGLPNAEVSARIQVWTLVTLLSAAVVTDVTKLPIQCHQSTMPSCRAGPRTTTPTTTTWKKAQMHSHRIFEPGSRRRPPGEGPWSPGRAGLCTPVSRLPSAGVSRVTTCTTRCHLTPKFDVNPAGRGPVTAHTQRLVTTFRSV